MLIYIKTHKKFAIFLSIVMIASINLNLNSVKKNLSSEDYEYIPLFILDVDQISNLASFDDELELISSIQKSTFDVAPTAGSIGINKSREPKDVYLAEVAGCADRSRLIEKILIYYNFKTRHVSIYSTTETNSSIKSLLTPQTYSHALTEVLTKKGWMIVGSNYPWLGLDNENNPISIKQLKESIDNSSDIQWMQPPGEKIFEKPFVYVYGLYSRHGRFYPPYNFIPDINYHEFFQNLY
tara:strand:- start:318 stop:1034 length:717 start_codon:yes stop_codon:yes gene_type:complete